jgi:ribose transport system permease protein
MTARLARLRSGIGTRPWALSFLAAVAVWIAIYLETGRALGGTLTGAAEVSAFLVLVGIGQLFVITAGNGNIDLSIPSTMTLAAYFAVAEMNGQDGGLVAGLAVGLLVGVVVASANLIAILVLQIPPIVGTLAVGFIAQSASFVKSNNFTASPSPALERFVKAKLAGLPVLALCVLLVAAAAWLLLTRTRVGRSVQAVGQSARAAHYAGISIWRTVAAVYLLSGVLAALAGVLLAADSGGVQLDIAAPYLLSSIAVVVLGGSLIEGGRSYVQGVWGAALFLSLLVTLLTVVNINVAAQNVIKGLMIVSVLAIAGGAREEL